MPVRPSRTPGPASSVREAHTLGGRACLRRVTTTLDTTGRRRLPALISGRSTHRGFLDLVGPFIRDGVDARQPVMVAVIGPRIAALRTELGTAAQSVEFVDMSELGRNPARIIPAWREFIDRHRSAGPVRGVGEPIWAGRRAAELQECQLHEA